MGTPRCSDVTHAAALAEIGIEFDHLLGAPFVMMVDPPIVSPVLSSRLRRAEYEFERLCCAEQILLGSKAMIVVPLNDCSTWSKRRKSTGPSFRLIPNGNELFHALP